jgi:hypothetical protein
VGGITVHARCSTAELVEEAWWAAARLRRKPGEVGAAILHKKELILTSESWGNDKTGAQVKILTKKNLPFLSSKTTEQIESSRGCTVEMRRRGLKIFSLGYYGN